MAGRAIVAEGGFAAGQGEFQKLRILDDIGDIGVGDPVAVYLACQLCLGNIRLQFVPGGIFENTGGIAADQRP